MTNEELANIIKDHNLWLQDLSTGERADLSGVNLKGMNLSGYNLSGANLSYAFMTGTIMKGTDLSGADLRNANLTGAELSESNLNRADLRRANLEGAKLRLATLRGADIRRTYFAKTQEWVEKFAKKQRVHFYYDKEDVIKLEKEGRERWGLKNLIEQEREDKW